MSVSESTRRDGRDGAAQPVGGPVHPIPGQPAGSGVYMNADAAPFWSASQQGRLVLQRCATCGHVRFPPRYLCPKCAGSEVEWVESPGVGRVHSFTVVHRAPLPALQAKVPYVVSVIDLDEGPRMIANIIGPDALRVQIGDPVRVVFEPGGIIPQFRRTTSEALGPDRQDGARDA